MTILMVSHDAERIAEFSDRVAVLHKGRIQRVDEPLAIFEDAELLREAGLGPPQVTEAALQLNAALGTDLHFVTLSGAEEQLRADLGGGV